MYKGCSKFIKAHPNWPSPESVLYKQLHPEQEPGEPEPGEPEPGEPEPEP